MDFPASNAVPRFRTLGAGGNIKSSEEATDHSPSLSERLPCAFAKGKRTSRARPAVPVIWSELPVANDEEDEEIAQCLLLLARSGAEGGAAETAQQAVPAGRNTGRYVCKTCGRQFSSNQALENNCRSHKKPKPPAGGPNEEQDSGSCGHVCSICWKEFASGQALGGHMRRHRPSAAKSWKLKVKGILDLDLNLPPPAEEGSEDLPPPPAPAALGFPFFFSATALVDCHY